MEIKIKMLDIGDGDAIIVQLKKSNGDLIILIDGGNAKNSNKVIQNLDPILKENGKSGPDLIVCTHYDADHIGGLKKIAEHYRNKIGTVWVHKPNLNDLNNTILRSKLLLESNNSEEAKELKAIFLMDKSFSKFQTKILESYRDMEEFANFLDNTNIPVIEPFAGYQYPGWENEIEVLGPSESFYNTLLPKLKNTRIQISEQLLYESTNENKTFRKFSEILNPCEALEKKKKAKVTAVNQASIILRIVVNGQKYLFTGDAAINSFLEIPGYPEVIRDIFWLKVAHHGSRNNNSNELFKIMTPKYAFISGNRHIDQEVITCLKGKNVDVRTTRDDKDLSFPL